LVGKPEGKRLLGRNRGRWEDNIKMGSFLLAHDRDRWQAIVNSVMNFGISQNTENVLNSLGSY
jgi:hypothetical protein